jgi:hypothetical protein
VKSFRDLFVHVHNTQHPSSLLRLADAALSAAGRAKKGKTPEATNAFRRVQEEMNLALLLLERRN